MGDGIAIVPSEGVLVAPVSGTVEALFPTSHALAIKDDSGIGVMLHRGASFGALREGRFLCIWRQKGYAMKSWLICGPRLFRLAILQILADLAQQRQNAP